MIKWFRSATVVLALTLLLGVSGAWASGKMQVKIGERVDLAADSLNLGASFKWVVKKGTEILETQTTRNFSYIFPSQGEYMVNLTATGGKVVENTTVEVLVGDLYRAPVAEGEEATTGGPTGQAPLRLTLETLPPMTPDRTVHLLGSQGRVSFLLDKSVGDITEYRIDRNVFKDSDGNGVSNDDIDNAQDTSYLTGQPWSAEYKSGETPKIVAEVTLVDKTGRKAKGQVEIVFDPLDQTGDPLAVLEVSPSPNPKDNLVHLYEDPQTVSLYARKSKGKILEYRIDRDVFTDSDGNGNPSDDIDNRDDPSFKSGDVWQTSYAKTDKQIIAQLIVVGEGGKGSRVQRGFVFGAKPTAPLTPEETGGLRLTADKEFVMKGDPITFTVEGLPGKADSYVFSWDFDGDGTVDQETEGQSTVQTLYEVPGVLTAKVKVTDTQGNSESRDLEIVVKDTVMTKADFSYEVSGNTVTFKDLSTVALNLSNKTLSYEWSFGDTDPAGYEAQKGQIGLQNPTYTYAKAGKYLVTLTITDADQVTDSRLSEIEIAQDLTPSEGGAPTEGEQPAEGGAPAAGGSFILKLLKVFLYLILIVIVLLVLVVGGFLAFLKAKHPELTFEELVEEAKNKAMGMIGLHDFEAHPGVAHHEALPTMPSTPATPHEETTAGTESTQPAWAQKKDIIEGEVEEEKKDDNDKTPPPPVGEQGPTPDWLKGVK